MIEWKKDGEKISEGIEKYLDFLGEEAGDMKTNVAIHQKAIEDRIKAIKEKMNAVYDALYSISTINDIEQIIADIKRLFLYGIPDSDMEDFKEIEKALSVFLADTEIMMEEQNNRVRFHENYGLLHQKYENAEIEFDLLSVLEDLSEHVENELDAKDNAWSSKHLSKIPDSLPAIHTWIQDTEALPNYLSDETRLAFEKMKNTVEIELSKAKIDDVVFRFNALSDEEKQNCIRILSGMV